MQKIKQKLHLGGRHHEHEHDAAEEVPIDTIVPGSVPVTGTYSKTEAEYQAAMGNAGVTTRSERATEGLGSIGEGSELRHTSETAGEVVAERPVAVGVAEVPVVVTEQERIVGSREHHTQSHGSERLRSEIQRDEALIHHAEDLMHQSEMHRAERVGVQQQQQQRVGEEVCGTKTFTVVEDRPVIRERVERIVEHRPVEKQYVVETRYVGDKEMGMVGGEIVDTKERVVDVAAPGPTCPVNTGAIMTEVVESMGHLNTGGTATGTHTHGMTDRL